VARYVLYGRPGTRETVALQAVLAAKGLGCTSVEEGPSLSLSLAARAGTARGPYLRTPEGFLLAGLHAVLDWLERVHPQPPLLPPRARPLRRACARMLEDWIELWLPLWPHRSVEALTPLERHLAAAGFLLGRAPTRPDWLLAAWLESEVLSRAALRERLAVRAPRLVAFGRDLLEAPGESDRDDAIPIGLLTLLEPIVRDYHAYLVANHAALRDGREGLALDLGRGPQVFPVRAECERRRFEIARELAELPAGERRGVRGVLEPMGAWAIQSLPSALRELDPADPRSL
jgi:glutathione S-transferase